MSIQDFYRQDPIAFLHSDPELFDWYSVCEEERKWTSWKKSDCVQAAARQKSIEIGKKHADYQMYISRVPKEKRKKGDPSTPKIERKCSRRNWDSSIKSWKEQVHVWCEKQK